MSKDAKNMILVIGGIIAIYWMYSHWRDESDAKSQVVGMLRQFCNSHGGFKRDLADDYEAAHGQFFVTCVDGSSATGFYKYPDHITFYNKNFEEIKF